MGDGHQPAGAEKHCEGRGRVGEVEDAVGERDEAGGSGEAHKDQGEPRSGECIITDEPYRPDYSNDELKKIAMKLVAMGPSKIVITGIQRGHYIGNYCYEKNREDYLIKTMKVGTQRSGTGDIFASIIAADAVNGVNFHESVRKASTFIKKCILKAIEMDIPLTDGVPFEELLTTLK